MPKRRRPNGPKKEMPFKFEVGTIVNYHPIIGEESDGEK